MELFGLLGYPLGHSVSKEIHQKLFALNRVDADYSYYEIAPENFTADFKNLSVLSGFNITIPYKRSVLKYMDHLDKGAVRFDAINTVKNDGGVLTGYNTDHIGFKKALSSAGIALNGRVLVGGTGGASRMMAICALEASCEVTALSRTEKSASDFKADLARRFPRGKISYITHAVELQEGQYDIYLNGTPVGMYPRINECPLPDSAVAGFEAVFDAVYNPSRTLLLQKCEEYGVKCAGGLLMLVAQAAAAQEIWLGVDFREQDLIKICDDIKPLLK